MECPKVANVVKKVKKKQVKDELDRIKQAEKKKRRLEKALATSLAIRSELEKKKQKKKEEQQRLDEEGAAIAEAVALNVLLGEDSDDSYKFMAGKKCSIHNVFGSQCTRNGLVNGECSFSSDITGNEYYRGYFENHGWENNTDFSAGFLAVQSLSSLRIGEEAQVDRFGFN